MNKNISSSIDTLTTGIIAILLFLFPILFFTSSTDFFIIPKQILIIGGTCLLLLLWGVKTIYNRNVSFNLNPLNLPILIFSILVMASAILALNRFDSLLQAVPLLFAVFFFYVLVNTVRSQKSFSVVFAAYAIGAAASALITIAYSLKLYFIPITAIQSPFFNTFGSSVQQLIYLTPALVLTLFSILKKIGFPKVKLNEGVTSDPEFFVEAATTVALAAGLAFIIGQIIFLPNKPIILPYVYGFQTAAAAITQDAQRFFLSLLFGSGYGTFLVDFTRFKLATFNAEPTIWNLSFSFSSSYFLELIATTGVLGAISFAFLLFSVFQARSSKNPFFTALVVAFVLAFILPFSFLAVFMLFALCALYVAYLNIKDDKRTYDVTFSLVTAKSGMLSFETTPEGEKPPRNETPVLSIFAFIVILAVVGFFGYFTYKFMTSDFEFASSLAAAQANNGQKTYTLQTQAITDFPYRSDYQRIFSQINLALANSLAGSVPQGSSPSAQVQQNIVGLFQQGINSARNAVTLSPQTAANWENLAQIYRSLINVGQNAEQFSIASENQAIALDPFNPTLYIELGGIYYQLKQWDAAQNQFQVAINLKRDYANGYYNLGHTLEQKNDLTNALAAYQVVKQLSGTNKQNVDQINKEIAAIEAKIGQQKNGATNTNVGAPTEQAPLSISSPSAALPAQKNPVKIAPPPPNTTEGGLPIASESAK